MSEMISLGGGWNSDAMTILLVNDGWRGPIVFADTGSEHPETYCHLRYFEQEWLRTRGLEITMISPLTHPDLYDDKRVTALGGNLETFCRMLGILPTLSVRWCSKQFKTKPLENWRKQHGIERPIVGIAADESHRAIDSTVIYPLVDRGIGRAECARIIQRAGLELPVKSGCFFCPGQPLASWRRLFLDHPDLYERAAEMERVVNARSETWITLDPHGQSLDQMREKRWQGTVEMDLGDYMPCACRL